MRFLSTHRRRASAGLALFGLLGAAAVNGAPATAAATELPVYEVRSVGLDQGQAAALQKAFGLKDLSRSEDGSVAFADEARYLNVPSLDKGKGRPDEDGQDTTITALDYEGLKKLTAIPTDVATKRALEGLRGAGLLPGNAKPTAKQTTFEVVDGNGRPTVTAALDTAVSFGFTVDGVPLEGPGAKIRVAFDGQGQVVQLSYSTRELVKGGSVPVYDLESGKALCARALGSGVKADAASYVYAAPALAEKVGKIEPGFRCTGSTPDGGAVQAITVPAAIGAPLPEPSPGQPPREQGSGFAPQSVTRTDVGSEGTGPCSGLPHTGANLASFNNQFTSRGIPVQFSWLNQNAWESDFKDPSFAGGHDDVYADDVDMTYWQGHGSPWGFYFSGCSNHDDSVLSNTDARWGQRDVEWMSLFTCLILKQTEGGQAWWQRWGPAFRGLHQINSFDTVSYHSATHGGIFANYMLRSPFLWWNNPMKVRDAWAQASIDTQPASVTWATMGAIGGGGVTNANDFFWGKGAVGPDTLPTTGYWRLSGTS